MHPSFRLLASRMALVASSLALLSCGGSDEPPALVLTTLNASLSVATIQVGQTANATAAGLDQKGAAIATGAVIWSSSPTSVATVSASGVVTGIAPGTASITAAAGGKQGSQTITVIPVPVASVVVAPPSPSVVLGATQQLTATTLDANGGTLTGRTVTWSSSAPSIATVDATGLVTSVAVGSTTITATSETKTGTSAVTVTPVPISIITVSPLTPTIFVGATQQLTATLKDAGGNILTGRVVTWTTSDATKATVNATTGLVTGVAAGTPTITATSEGKTGSSFFTVQVPVATVTVSPLAPAIAVGATTQLTATTNDAGGSSLVGRPVTWQTSDATKATVNSTGLVTGVAVGTATITATSEGKSGTSTVTVTDAACANPISLALGEVRALSAAEKSAVCIAGGVSGSEYAIIPFSRATVASSNIALAYTATNTSAIQFLPAPPPSLSVGTSGLAALDGTRAEIAFRARERREIGSLRSRARVRSSSSAPSAKSALRLTGILATPVVGSTVQINTTLTGNSCTDAKVLHNATVVAVLTHTIVLVDQAAPTGGYTSVEMTAFGTTFDTLAYPVDVNNFGAPTDLDANGRVAILFTPSVNQISAQPGAVVLGLFNSRDLFSATSPGGCASSNEGEMFYMPVPDPSSTLNGNYVNKTSLGNTVVATLGHEFQHLINAGRRIYVNGASDLEEVWLNEGLSHVAEELVYYASSKNASRANINLTLLSSSQAQVDAFNNFANQNFGRLKSYMAATELNSPFASNDNLETRGAIWQLLRYAADQKGGTESATWSALVNATTSGVANFNTVFPTGMTTLAHDWTIAQFTDDAGLTVAANFTNPSWNFRSIWPGLGAATFPLFTRSLLGTVQNLALGGGSAAYMRFRIAAGLNSVISANSLGNAVPSSVDVTLVRTH